METRSIYLTRTHYSRVRPGELDQFLHDLDAFCKERGFVVTRGGVTVSETIGGDELPRITIELMQMPEKV